MLAWAEPAGARHDICEVGGWHGSCLRLQGCDGVICEITPGQASLPLGDP